MNRMNEKWTKNELAQKWKKLGGDVPPSVLDISWKFGQKYQSELDLMVFEVCIYNQDMALSDYLQFWWVYLAITRYLSTLSVLFLKFWSKNQKKMEFEQLTTMAYVQNNPTKNRWGNSGHLSLPKSEWGNFLHLLLASCFISYHKTVL